MISDRNLSAATAGPTENPTLHTQAMRETLTMEISTGANNHRTEHRTAAFNALGLPEGVC